MITEMEYVKRMLSLGGYSLVLCEHSRVITSEKDGIVPLLETVQSGENWKNAYAAVKKLGRAEGLLLLFLKVQGVYAETACKPALRLLERNGVQTEFKTVVVNFLNEEKTGLSCMEAAVYSLKVQSPDCEAVRGLYFISEKSEFDVCRRESHPSD